MLYLDIYRLMLSDKKYGLSVNLMATRVMPSLLPQTINPSLNLDQFTILMEVTYFSCVFFASNCIIIIISDITRDAGSY